jgi:hypothetical protein
LNDQAADRTRNHGRRQRTSLFTGLLIRQLDEAFVAVGQYLGEGEDFVFREQIATTPVGSKP